MMIDRTPLILIGCSAKKLTIAAPARELYRGDLFRKSVTYAESRGAAWLVLSAKHGVLGPDDMVAPYSVTLNGRDRETRKLWATDVYRQLRKRGVLSPGRTVTILAGIHYREYLSPRLIGEGHKVLTPLAYLGIGDQKSRLARAITTGETL